MNICFFDATPRWSGGATRVFLLAKELKKRNHSVVICCLPDSEISKKCVSENIAVELISPLFDINPVAFIRISGMLSRHNVQIVDLNSPKFYWLVSFAAKLKRIKTVLTRNVPYRKSGIKKITNAFLYNSLVDKIVTVSHKIKNELAEDFHIHESKIEVIYDGLELPDTAGMSKNTTSILSNFNLPGLIFVGVISRLDYNKGLEYFIESIPLVLEKKNNVRFVIMGTGKMEDELKKKVHEYSLDDKVVFTGFVSEREKCGILSALDITVVPSAKEGIARSALESMAFSKPVIATTTSSISEVIEDGINGILVEPYSPQEIADGVLRLLKSDYKQIGGRARKVIEEKFSIHSFVSSYEKLYKDLTEF